MSKDIGSETIESIAGAGAPGQQQVSVQVDDATTPTTYASTVRVWGSAEEVNLDFSTGLRPTGPKNAVLKIDHRMVLNPWAAKRLAIVLGQTIQRYEATYGELELDERKRRRDQGGAA